MEIGLYVESKSEVHSKGEPAHGSVLRRNGSVFAGLAGSVAQAKLDTEVQAKVDLRLESFVSTGVVAEPLDDAMNAMTIDSQISGRGVQVSILRDTGCTQSLLLSSKVPVRPECFSGNM